MPTLVRILVYAVLAGFPALAVAAPRTIADCERIEAADIYNRCLASFGPPARSLRLHADAPSKRNGKTAADTGQTVVQRQDPDEEEPSARGADRRASARQHQLHAKRMVFSIVSDHARTR